MKTTIHALIFMALLATAIAGCKKETTNDPHDPNNVNGLIEKLTFVNINPNTLDTSSTGETHFTYDANGWQTKRDEYNNGTLEYTYTYANSSSKVVQTTFNHLSGATTLDTFYLNAQGYIDHATNFSNVEPNTYDSEGHLTKQVFQVSGFVYTYIHTWVGGNKTQMKATSDPAFLDYTYNYTYSTDKKDYRSMGNSYYGKGSAYMVLSNNGGVVNWSYAYTYDSKERPVTEIETLTTGDPNQNNTKYTTYTYTN